mmetsp:Transcript_8753/g.19624  ORF Transcript_8753/g.19624 Transcript_8753/m.19624 type:complete len:242 (-) Transcript_8753:424-1149(-)
MATEAITKYYIYFIKYDETSLALERYDIIIQSKLFSTSLKSSQHLPPNSIHSLIRIHPRYNSMRLVMFKNRHSLPMVSIQPLYQSSSRIIWSLHQCLTRLIILHTFRNRLSTSIRLHTFRRSILDMITPSTLLMNPPSTNPLLQHLIRNLQLHHLGNTRPLFGQHFIQLLRLNESAGKSIEDESKFTVGLLDAIADDADDNVVRNESSGFHDGGCLESYFGFGGDGSTEHVAGGELGDAKE